ncbi:hypothetical protein [Joostella sp.]
MNNLLNAMPFLGTMAVYLANVKDVFAIVLMVVTIIYYIVKIRKL